MRHARRLVNAEAARIRESQREDHIAYNSPKAMLHFSKPLDEMQLDIGRLKCL